jgi:hypothetical protein
MYHFKQGDAFGFFVLVLGTVRGLENDFSRTLQDVYNRNPTETILSKKRIQMFKYLKNSSC